MTKIYWKRKIHVGGEIAPIVPRGSPTDLQTKIMYMTAPCTFIFGEILITDIDLNTLKKCIEHGTLI